MKTIVSKQNPALIAARKLAERKARDKSGAFLVEGRKLIGEARAAGFEMETLFVNAGALARGDDELAAFAADAEDALGRECAVALEERLYTALARTVSPPPALAVMRRKKTDGAAAPCAADSGSVLALDRIADPGNVGTMIRSALAAGMSAVWCVSGTADIFSDKAIRASAGAVFHLPAIEGLSARDCIEMAGAARKKLVVLASGGENIYDADLGGDVVFVTGNEGQGADAAFVGAADALCGIPMSERSESLNAAAAAAIAMYEKLRRER